MNNYLDNLIELFDKKEELEDNIDLINRKLDILKFKQSSFKEISTKNYIISNRKYDRNWICDI